MCFKNKTYTKKSVKGLGEKNNSELTGQSLWKLELQGTKSTEAGLP